MNVIIQLSTTTCATLMKIKTEGTQGSQKLFIEFKSFHKENTTLQTCISHKSDQTQVP